MMLRLEYVTDQSYNGQGFAFKDLHIAEIGLQEPGATDGQWSRALEDFSRAAAIEPRLAEANDGRGATYLLMKSGSPGALVAFEDLAHGDALGVLNRAATPELGAHLPLSVIQSALKRGGRQRNVAARARQVQAALRTDQAS